MKKIIAIAVISLGLISCGGVKEPYKICLKLKTLTLNIGPACYTDKAGPVGEKAVRDYIQKHYSGDSAEMNAALEYCKIIREKGDKEMSKEDALRASMSEFKSSSCYVSE